VAEDGGVSSLCDVCEKPLAFCNCEEMRLLPKSLFEYRGDLYPDYIRRGNAMQFILPTAQQFCKGRGVDVGCGAWPLPGATPVDVKLGGEAMSLSPEHRNLDFVFSSHCLEHLADPVAAIEHWKSRIRPGGALFLYLPHPDMVYWRPQHCRKHRHSWMPAQMAEILTDLGFVDVIHGERDLAWSFAVVGFNP
jgi:SAM-dependent methyltransferase